MMLVKSAAWADTCGDKCNPNSNGASYEEAEKEQTGSVNRVINKADERNRQTFPPWGVWRTDVMMKVIDSNKHVQQLTYQVPPENATWTDDFRCWRTNPWKEPQTVNRKVRQSLLLPVQICSFLARNETTNDRRGPCQPGNIKVRQALVGSFLVLPRLVWSFLVGTC